MRGGPDDRELPVCILLDNVTAVADTVEANLVDAAEGILRLTAAGAMVGLEKCEFGVEEGKHLGDWWTSGGYFRPPPGRMAALLELSEDTLAGMVRSKIYGMVGYWREYLPDFAARTSRLCGLLSRDAAPWTPSHTAELRAVVRGLMEAAPMINFSPADPVVMETHTGPKGMAAVFLQ